MNAPEDGHASPAGFTPADVLAVLALEDLATASDAAATFTLAVDVALIQRGHGLQRQAKLVRSARFSYRAGEGDAAGAAQALAFRAPHSALVRVAVSSQTGHTRYCWVGLQRRFVSRH